ncbi:hypothetical protein H2808_005478, partial [Escherichia coli]|nr:hypothetical protein [Escherichia coli]EFC9433485.1 hypothetical protein [Escherichia coli]EFT5942077.1 hypothetical protein [Escherichia coli]EHK2690701.1 type III secretion system filament chaperone [Escherichia coli]EJT8463690.1 type III secretion system filament chaperone [Escherichia coli]
MSQTKNRELLDKKIRSEIEVIKKIIAEF